MNSNQFKKELIYENKDSLESVKKSQLNIIHFNDVYNVESDDTDPCGGAARFLTAVECLMQNGPTIVLFSGDALSPSKISILAKGKQMIDVLNKCHISCACLGNHDFDFGLEILLKHISDSKFPWILSNVQDSETRKPLGNVNAFEIVEANGLKIGIIGLVEEEWISTLSTISYDDVIFKNFSFAGKKLAKKLKNKHKCDFVIALTHMRWTNDTILAENVPEIDIYLGGHDHDYVVKQINNKWVVKSGTDFKEFSYLEISLDDDKKLCVDKIEKYIVNSDIPENPEIKSIVDSYLVNLNKEEEVLLGYMNTELDGRFAHLRTEETNLGNFICDTVLSAVQADCAFYNSGSMRSNIIHPTGEFKVRDLKKILPFPNQESVCISIKGKQLLKVLENSVSKYPDLEGRFLQVSGIQFAFDPSKPVGNRVDPALVKVRNEPLQLEKDYSAVTLKYIQLGKEEYDMLKDCPILNDGENIPVLFSIVENYFKTVEKLKSDNDSNRLRQSIVPLVQVQEIIESISKESLTEMRISSNKKLSFKGAALMICGIIKLKKISNKGERIAIKKTDKFKDIIKKIEQVSMQLAPKIENRITCIQNQQHLESLLNQK